MERHFEVLGWGGSPRRSFLEMPLHRSLLFWFGACGLAFLVWGWWDSMAHESHLHWKSPSKLSEFDLSNNGAKIVLHRSRSGDGGSMASPLEDIPIAGNLFSKNFFRYPPFEPSPWLAWPGYSAQTEVTAFPMIACGLGPEGDGAPLPDLIFINDSWQISHWLLIACYLPPWLGTSMWRARRIAKRDAMMGGAPT